ncbi:DUF6233 domain-containing protein [Streptomyces sp. NPDC004059]
MHQGGCWNAGGRSRGVPREAALRALTDGASGGRQGRVRRRVGRRRRRRGGRGDGDGRADAAGDHGRGRRSDSPHSYALTHALSPGWKGGGVPEV